AYYCAVWHGSASFIF
nr:immunoglobulin light chain junction region [Macaca mulatta]